MHITRNNSKDEVRKKLLKWRNSLSDGEREAKGLEIQKAFMETAEFRKAKRLCCYVSVGSEAGTRHLIRESLKQGKLVTIPLLEPSTKALRLYQLKDASFIGASDFSIMMEPGNDSRVALMKLGDSDNLAVVDIVVVPGIAFDRAGHRIGSGRGCYDRDILPLPEERAGRAGSAAALFVGFCYDEQLVPELPNESHDIPVNMIVTPTKKIEIQGK